MADKGYNKALREVLGLIDEAINAHKANRSTSLANDERGGVHEFEFRIYELEILKSEIELMDNPKWDEVCTHYRHAHRKI